MDDSSAKYLGSYVSGCSQSNFWKKNDLMENKFSKVFIGSKNLMRGRPCSTYAEFSKKLTFLTPLYALVRTYAYQWVRNVSFSENSAYVLDE